MRSLLYLDMFVFAAQLVAEEPVLRPSNTVRVAFGLTMSSLQRITLDQSKSDE